MKKTINIEELRADKDRLEQTINDLIGSFRQKHELDAECVVVTNPCPIPLMSRDRADESYKITIKLNVQ